MSFLKWIFVLCCLQCISHLTYGQSKFKFFRKDYQYIEETSSFYKIHTIHRNWYEAKERCELEGATLFYPFDEDEALAVINLWNTTQSFALVYIGVSTPNVKEVFETVDNRRISDVYDNWGPGEPNNAGGVEECVIMRRDGKLNAVPCNRTYPFICKKTFVTLKWNEYCNMPDSEYEYVDNLSRCYKVHLAPRNWRNAYTICSIEQSYLAIINTEAEAKYLVELINKAPTDQVLGNSMPGAVHLGFRYKEGWKTIRGLPLEENGYSKWWNGQPDGGDKEKCGSMFYNGSLSDISCDTKTIFICEHEVGILKRGIILKF